MFELLLGLSFALIGFWFCCGCSDCSFFSDNFNRASIGGDWTSVSGSWSIDANELETTSSSAVIISDTLEPSNDDQQVITVKFKSTADNDLIRVIIGYADSSNYLYVEFEIGDCGTLSFWEVSGGTHTQLGADYAVAVAKDTWHTVQVCYNDNDYPVANRLETLFESVLYTEDVDAPASGDQGGLGTGGTVTGTVNFDDWDQETYDAGDGCPTCGPNAVVCQVFTDNFNRGDSTDIGCNWTEVQEDWEISSNTLIVTATSAIAKVERPHPLGLSNSKLTLIAQSDTDGDELRFLVDYVDDGNFHFGELTVGTNGKLAIFKMAGGVPTELASVSGNFAVDFAHTVEFCFGNGTADISLNGDSDFSFGVGVTEHGGKFVGLGTGDVTGNPLFENFVWERSKHPTLDDQCDDCQINITCNNCKDNVMPTEFMAVVAGTFSSNDETDCPSASEACSDLTGTFVVSQVTGFPCRRRYVSSITPCTGCGSYTLTVKVDLVGSDYILNVNWSEGSASIQWEKNYGTTKPDCSNFEDEEIPYKTTLGTCCTADSNSTIELTAI